MSHFVTCKTEFRNLDCLVKALMECGKWSKEQIEIHGIPVHLYGYQGDQREQMANVVIRRNHVGVASNDIGFIQNEDGTYSAIISEYDSNKYNETWQTNLRQRYAVNVVKETANMYGHALTEQYDEGTKQYVMVINQGY